MAGNQSFKHFYGPDEHTNRLLNQNAREHDESNDNQEEKNCFNEDVKLPEPIQTVDVSSTGVLESGYGTPPSSTLKRTQIGKANSHDADQPGTDNLWFVCHVCAYMHVYINSELSIVS